MKTIRIPLAIIALCLSFCISAQDSQSLLNYVNPNIGTAHSRWFFYTPAALPFGMAKVAPSTNGSLGNKDGWQAVGYDSRHTSIEGFVNTHEFQVGGISIMPTTGKLVTVPGSPDGDGTDGYRSSFDKKDEHATAGYYSVILKDYDIKAELTATCRVGFHRYTFPDSDEAHLLFDIGRKWGESGPAVDACVKYDGKAIYGYVITEPVYVLKYQTGSTVPIYFYALVDQQPKEYGTFSGQASQPSATESHGVGSGFYMTFDTRNNRTVEVKVGVSYTSVENAKLNLESEATGMNFDEAHKQATKTWEDALGRIKVEGGTEADRTKFYTGLFHALLGRGLASDINGVYPRNDGTIGQIEIDPATGKPKHGHYNTDAMWGGYWNLSLLWALAYPEYYSDFVQSQLLVYKETGWLADGIANSRYVSGVGTNFMGLIIAGAYNCGIRDFDVNLAYEAARKNELEWVDRPVGVGKPDVGAFVEYGYSPYVRSTGSYDEYHRNGSPFGASHTLEYSFSSYAVAQFAKALGKKEDYKTLSRLAEGWRHIYDPSTGFVRPKDKDGKFLEKFDPSRPWVGFQEGNAWQYTFYVPHHATQLVELVGADRFNTRLDSIFIVSQENVFGGGKTVDAFAGISGLYNHGNQPNLHISWLFNFSGRPWLSQKWVRTICNEFYGTEEIHGYGYGQDEDQGQLGAWYVMSSIGLFDVKGLSDQKPSYQIGSPVFDRVTITLPANKRKKPFVIEAENNSPENLYIQEVQLNGKRLKSYSLPYDKLVAGGTLKLKMGNTPNTKMTK